jgi:hypothetical protein
MSPENLPSAILSDLLKYRVSDQFGQESAGERTLTSDLSRSAMFAAFAGF